MTYLCDYGCGNEALHVFKNGKHCCSKNVKSCPVVNERAAEKLRGTKHSQETKDKIIAKISGRTLSEEWRTKIGNAGRGRKHTAETKEKCRESKLGDKNPNYGKPAWNRGLTKETHSGIGRSASKQTGIKRNHSEEGLENIRKSASASFSGENNPWFGKSRSKELSPRYLGETHNSEFKRYRGLVSMLTEKTYKQHEAEINPNGYKRGKCGIDGAYQLDHIVSVKQGFDLGLPVESLADRQNLQMLPWEENLSKYDNKGDRSNSITEDVEQLLSTLIDTYGKS